MTIVPLIAVFSRFGYCFNEKAFRETQTLRAGCIVIKAEPKKFAPPQTPFPGVRDGQNLISWRWSPHLPTNPVWWGLMHAISSYRGNRPTNTHTQTHKHTHRQDRLQYTMSQLSAQCNNTYWLNRQVLVVFQLQETCKVEPLLTSPNAGARYSSLQGAPYLFTPLGLAQQMTLPGRFSGRRRAHVDTEIWLSEAILSHLSVNSSGKFWQFGGGRQLDTKESRTPESPPPTAPWPLHPRRIITPNTPQTVLPHRIVVSRKCPRLLLMRLQRLAMQ